MMKPRRYTEEQKKFIRENAKSKTTKELTKLFNIKFNETRSERSIKVFKDNNKIRSGVKTHFKKGHKPWNANTKGKTKPNSGSFREGNKPKNNLPIGSECAFEDYIFIKVGGPRKWMAKNRYIWEKHYGDIPSGCSIIFKDKNNKNFNIENLQLVRRSELAILNKNGLIFDNPELTEIGVNIAKLRMAEKELKERRKS